MPDVIIKGMEMPECCAECRLSEGLLCYASGALFYKVKANLYTDRPAWCPLRPAPEWRCTITDPPKPGQVITFMGFGETTGSGMLLDKMQITFWNPLPEPPEGGDEDG